jgi:Family of unknown function (DUF6406)
MSVGEQVNVGKGSTFDADGLSFGGSYHLPATDAKLERVILTVWDEESSEQDFELSVGEALEFAGQTWRLDEIDDTGSRWYATLTRTA